MPKPKLYIDNEVNVEKVKKRKVSEEEEKSYESDGVIFDEILDYEPDQSAKFSKKIKFSSSEAVGLKGDKVYVFRVYKKDDKDEISKYQFGFDISAVNNLKLALDKLKIFYKQK